MKSRTWNAILALVLLSVAFCAFVAMSVITTRKDASSEIRDLKELQDSKDTTATFEMLKRKYGSKLQPTQGCSAQDCQSLITVSNRLISALHLVPYAEMNVWFTVWKGSLVFALVEYRVALKRPNSPVVHVQVGMCAKGCGVRFDVDPHGTTQQTWNGIVEVDTTATSQQRDAALALNLACLARIAGCDDISELLPTIWARTGPATVKSRLVGMSQQLEESHGLPSPQDAGW